MSGSTRAHLRVLKSCASDSPLKSIYYATVVIVHTLYRHDQGSDRLTHILLVHSYRRYISYFMRRIDLFKHFGIKPYVVFDGGYLPSKAATEQDRFR